MVNIKNWLNFNESLTNALTEDDKDKIGKALIKSCKNIWGYINRYWVEAHGMKIVAEILRLSKNNRLLIDYVNNLSPAKTIDELTTWISSNEFELYHPKGQYFNNVINILTNSYNRGRGLEQKAKDVLIEYYDSKGILIEPFNPSRKRDEEGYDIFWEINGGIKSAQVKPLDKLTTGKFRDFIRCKGHLKPLVTNFFVAINDYECYIYKTYNHQVNPEYLSFPKSNIVYHKVF